MFADYHYIQMHAAGLLESVSNLAVVLINSSTVLISWSPPFTLEGVPILGYNVTVTTYNVTVFTKDVMLYHSIEHFNNIFTVTVVPINVVGAGKSTHTLYSPSKWMMIIQYNDDNTIFHEHSLLKCQCLSKFLSVQHQLGLSYIHLLQEVRQGS